MSLTQKQNFYGRFKYWNTGHNIISYDTQWVQTHCKVTFEFPYTYNDFTSYFSILKTACEIVMVKKVIQMWLFQKGFDSIVSLMYCLTFIISRIVLSTIRVMIKYSKGVDSTIRHRRYLKPTRSSGIYLSKGVALMAKSIQDF